MAGPTGYVSQMQAAWLTFATHGRREHPALVVVFAMLAAWLRCSASDSRRAAGPPCSCKTRARITTPPANYGPTAIDAMAERVGTHQLLYSSDRLVVDPLRTERDAVLQTNAARLFAEQVSAAGAA